METIFQKPTGVIRRIDDLGRIIIPREQRRMLNIKDGDPFEIFVGKDYVVFKKYNAEQPVRACAETLREAVNNEPALQNREAILEKLRELEELLNTKEET